MTNTDINLLKRSAASYGGIPHIVEDTVRLIAWWSLVAFFAVSIITGTAYLIVSSNIRSLEASNADLVRQINAQSIKEGIVLSLLQRSEIAGNALRAARPWGNLFPLLERITYQGYYQSLTVSESGKVEITYAVDSVNTAAMIVDTIIDLNTQNALKTPQLVSFIVEDDGKVSMGVSFVPVL